MTLPFPPSLPPPRSTSSSVRSPRAWTLSRRSRPRALALASPRARSPLPSLAPCKRVEGLRRWTVARAPLCVSSISVSQPFSSVLLSVFKGRNQKSYWWGLAIVTMTARRRRRVSVEVTSSCSHARAHVAGYPLPALPPSGARVDEARPLCCALSLATPSR